jgi:hypothetical protein
MSEITFSVIFPFFNRVGLNKTHFIHTRPHTCLKKPTNQTSCWHRVILETFQFEKLFQKWIVFWREKLILFFCRSWRFISPANLGHQLLAVHRVRNHQQHNHVAINTHPIHQQEAIKFHSSGLIRTVTAIATWYSPGSHCSLTESKAESGRRCDASRTTESVPSTSITRPASIAEAPQPIGCRPATSQQVFWPGEDWRHSAPSVAPLTNSFHIAWGHNIPPVAFDSLLLASYHLQPFLIVARRGRMHRDRCYWDITISNHSAQSWKLWWTAGENITNHNNTQQMDISKDKQHDATTNHTAIQYWMKRKGQKKFSSSQAKMSYTFVSGSLSSWDVRVAGLI